MEETHGTPQSVERMELNIKEVINRSAFGAQLWRGRHVRCACCAVIVSAHFKLAAIILNLIFNECTHASAQKKQTGEVILKSYNVWVERSHARLLIIPARICIQRREWWRFSSKLVRCASGPRTRIQTHTHTAPRR